MFEDRALDLLPMIDKDLVMGQPVHLDNIIVVPIINVSYGYGGVKSAGGAGVSLKPTGLLVVKDGEIEYFDLDKTGEGIKKIADVIPQIIAILNKEKDGEREIEITEPLP